MSRIFSEPIGKELDLQNCVSKWKIAKFQSKLSTKFSVLPNEVIADLSSHQHHANRICLAIVACELDDDLGILEVGPIVRSCLLTL